MEHTDLARDYDDLDLAPDPVIADNAPHGGVNRFVLSIPGEPVAKGRPKLGIAGGHAMAFTPKKTRHYEALVRERAVQAWQRPLLTGPVFLTVTFTRGIPASWPKKKRALATAGELWPTGKPDLSNLQKAVEDALNLTILSDDAIIVRVTAEKRYGLLPGALIVLTWA